MGMGMGVPSQGVPRECGEGVRLRAIACYDGTGTLVDPSHCSSSGYIEEPCTVPCPFDCKLSDWSSWSPCSSSCGPGVKVRSKWLKEKPYNGGRPCPKLDLKNQDPLNVLTCLGCGSCPSLPALPFSDSKVHEAVPCYSECNQYSWVVEPWSPCKINSEQNSLHCGEGIQTRKVRCVSAAEDHGGETVPSALCNQADIPDTVQKCSLYCPRGSVMLPQLIGLKVSPGTTASSRVCSDFHCGCKLESLQSGNASWKKTCGLLKMLGLSYQSLHSNWYLHTASQHGQGWKGPLEVFYSNSVLQQDSLKHVTQYCVQTAFEYLQRRLTQPLWAWHVCDPNVVQTRTRQVLRSPGSSKPCPEDSQMKPCVLNQNCFHYQYNLTGWSGCQLGANATCGHGERRRLLSCRRSDGATVSMRLCQQGGQCGDGLQVRNLTCVVHDAPVSAPSKPVEDALCGELPSKDSVLQLPCSVPCPGDCHLTEWSEWSSCELTCINGRSFETMGRQSRSRAFIVQSPENQESCSGQEMETRPCSGGKCYDYLWKTSLWRENRGVCGCERGYTEVMRSNGFLDYCVKVPGLEDKKADVKTITGKNKPVNSKMHDIFKGWSIQPFNPDGKLKMWVYGVSAGGFFIIVFLIFTSYLMCKKPKQHQSPPPQQKPLTLAYDGDIDM
ncbi:thrombospondin type-1 domain-containing protein 7B-like protein [Willisornis vidua]|uniref:Thrombospondin type-1 domain-containing protein 7B-like protein n=1 Tax=Willisornis vidua TaxID=1566151 RepID=A0ABQ9CWS9_9PASS|nr:thrombospondin type-1 domain-containing protein 7B-like protein [Willisornis vidua]